MKKLFYLVVFFSTALPLCGQNKTDDQKRDLAFYQATKKWFTAWKLVSKGIYKIDRLRPVEFVFFDDKYVYSTSATSITQGSAVTGNHLMNLKFQWKREVHHDSLFLPDKSVVPVNLMSFAAEIPAEGKSYFVMPLPEFWKQAGVVSKEVGLEKLVTGVFIHEFSHSQQMQNFGAKMTALERQHNYGIEFNDDLVQHIFAKDSGYLKRYKQEIEFLYNSVATNEFDKGSINKALNLIKQRQKEYFTGRYEKMSEIDDFFLTMEGLGQYSMFLWLQHPKGGNIQREIAIQAVRRGGKWWSQDEGFALFLMLDQLTRPRKWAKLLFGESTETVTELLSRNNFQNIIKGR